MKLSRSNHLLIFLSLESLTPITRTGLSIRTDGPGELCYNFSISNDLTQMVNFATRIPDCDFHSPALLDFFISSNSSIRFTNGFPSIGKF